ncbi:MAG TPA: hydroxysqualene dehydroxylase HpnE [Solirubrobacteraceae bacterium]|jgi:squalene-associated FAD-dependent desaturase|nr:hydroxysqualene dehydroxylase HpnE [Solirubrobacteraceae bacterium]
MSRGSVIVVGGGLAGIAAALQCAREGAEVTLLEARGRLGGAAYSFTRGELVVDNGQHVFLRCCSAYRELLEQLGATEMVALQRRLEVPVLAPGGRLGWLRRSALPAPLHLTASLLRYPYLGVRERLALAWAMRRLAAVDIEDPANDAVSFGDWLRRHRQSRRAVDAIWELIVRPTINLTVDGASLAQAAQVFQVGLLTDAEAGDIGWARVPLGEIHDTAARAALQRAGVTVQLRSTVQAIRRELVAGGRSEGRLRFLVDASDGSGAAADAVVLALPPAAAAQILPSQPGLAPDWYEHLGSSAIINLHVVFDRRVLEHPFAASVDSPVQWVFDRSAGSGLADGQYLAVSLSAADGELHATAEELRARYLPALAELLPAAAQAEVREFFVTREHSATFRAGPGVRSWRLGPHTDTPGLVLAGAWTDTGWPATMEGAVRSGRAAAGAVMTAIANQSHESARATVRV